MSSCLLTKPCLVSAACVMEFSKHHPHADLADYSGSLTGIKRMGDVFMLLCNCDDYAVSTLVYAGEAEQPVKVWMTRELSKLCVMGSVLLNGVKHPGDGN